MGDFLYRYSRYERFDRKDDEVVCIFDLLPLVARARGSILLKRQTLTSGTISLAYKFRAYRSATGTELTGPGAFQFGP